MSPAEPDARLLRLEWTVIRRLDGLLQGDYRTLFRGVGLDLADLREYQIFDDVRHIDWNVSARLGVPHVRRFNEEREVSAWFLIDTSPSVDFGSAMRRKREVAADFVGTLARILTRHGNRVGALFYGEDVDAFVPARSGRRHVLHLLTSLAARPRLERSGPTQLARLLSRAGQVLQRRSAVFVVSDFISEAGWGPALGHLARRHEVLAVRLHDPLETRLPDLGLINLQDAESGDQIVVDLHDHAFRRRFEAQAIERENQLRASLQDAGVDALELSTAEELVEALLRFADLRRRSESLRTGGTSRPGRRSGGSV